jgi:hypothetical protein
MWNHQVRFNGQSYVEKLSSWNIDAKGKPTLGAAADCWQEYPYYDGSSAASSVYYMIKCRYNGPARLAGEAAMLIDPLNMFEKGRRAYQYLPGQRRVKLAPELAFDTPNPTTAGASTYDDLFLFSGSMERYDWKLVGKREVYVPYNAYKAAYLAKTEELLTPRHLNPDFVRWELHRVWVVEATLREGKRHIYSKRRFYLDEDSWSALASESYDARDQLYRVGLAYQAPSYDVPASMTDFTTIYDLISGVYAANAWGGNGGTLKYEPPLAPAEWTGEALAGGGIR